METTALKHLTKQWDDIICGVLHLQELSLSKTQRLLKDTYRALTAFHKEELVPKEISKILLRMEEFLYFASLMEEKEKGKSFYHWEELNYVVNALKKGFFDAEYACDYPKLIVTDVLDNEFLIDLEKDRMECLVTLVQKVKCEEN